MTTMPGKPLLLMQTGDTRPHIIERHGNFDAMFLAAADFSPFTVHTVRVFDGEEPLAPSAYRGILVTGSPAMVSDREPWSEKNAVWIRRAIEGGCPVFGVCYGHQLIAHALGGRVDKNPKGPEMGTREISLTPEAAKHPLLRGLPPRFPVNLSHSESVLDLPPGATRLGSSDFDENQILAYGDTVLTVQFHPEFTKGIAMSYMERLPDTTKPGIGYPASETPVSRSLVQRFLDSLP